MKLLLSLGSVGALVGLLACGDSSTGAGGSSSSGTTASGTTASGTAGTTVTGSSTSTGASGCIELTVPKLALITPKPADGDYDYGAMTNAIGGAAGDQLEIDLFNGLDTPTVDIATDNKNKNPSTCEACGYVFQDGSGPTAAKIYYQESGTITLDVPNFGNQLGVQPNSVTLTNVTYREVTLGTAGDLHSATPVAGGACVHVASASTL